MAMSDENLHRITQDYLRQNNVVVKDEATHSPDMPPVDQVMHILVWIGVEYSSGSCCDASWITEVDFSAPNWAYCWTDERKSVGCGALQRDIVI